MTHYDVFNGDADGLCALHQLRLAAPRESVLVSGVKRDIALLERIRDRARAGDTVTVLDVSLDVNRAALTELLARGVAVEYFDHHYAGAAIDDPRLKATIDTSAGTCTGLLVDRHLRGRYRLWAIVAAYSDGLTREAAALARERGLPDAAQAALRDLGTTLAYNGYGDTEDDLVIHPADLYRRVRPFEDPFEFMRAEPLFGLLDARRRDDLELARAVAPTVELPGAAMIVLPDTPWSRRVRGVLANEWAERVPHAAHAVLTSNAHGGYTVSVRAPLATNAGADALCRGFATGGGRVDAAGINDLPRDALPEFVRRLGEAFR